MLKSLQEQLIKTTFSRLTDDQIWSNLTKNNTQALSHKISEKEQICTRDQSLKDATPNLINCSIQSSFKHPPN